MLISVAVRCSSRSPLSSPYTRPLYNLLAADSRDYSDDDAGEARGSLRPPSPMRRSRWPGGRRARLCGAHVAVEEGRRMRTRLLAERVVAKQEAGQLATRVRRPRHAPASWVDTIHRDDARRFTIYGLLRAVSNWKSFEDCTILRKC